MNMKLRIALLAALGIFVLRGETNAVRDAENQAAERVKRRAAAREAILRKTGGPIVKPGKGSVAVVDMQRKVPRSDIETSYRYFVGETSLDFKYVPQMADKDFSMADIKVPAGSSAALFIVDDPKLPMSLVAVESHWGLVNIGAITKGVPDSGLTKNRLGKLMTRVAAMTLGGGREGQYSQSIFEAISDAQDLDSLSTDRLSQNFVGGIVKNAKSIGLEPRFRTVYRKAVEQGWAPAPTNDIQKAVWDEVHAMPSAPLKIKPETKKVAE